METKAYTGLVGEMFRSSREDEFVQVVRRPCPIFADEEIMIDRLSNVPTRLPIDERLTWAADPDAATWRVKLPHGDHHHW